MNAKALVLMNTTSGELCLAYPLFFDFITGFGKTDQFGIYFRESGDLPAAYAMEAGDENCPPMLVRQELVQTKIDEKCVEIIGEL